MATLNGSLNPRETVKPKKFAAPDAQGAGRLDAKELKATFADPKVTARVRGYHRGVISAPILIIDLAASYLQNRTAKVQARAIDQMTSAVVNNPGLAADLLEKYNPLDWNVKRRMVTQKYGVRVTQVLNILDEAHDQDDVRDAVVGDE